MSRIRNLGSATAPCLPSRSIQNVLIGGYTASVGSLLQIRDVPDDVRQALKARAAARGESLNTYLLRLLGRDAARPTAREVFERAARRTGRAEASVMDTLDAARREREGELAGPSA